MVQVMKGIASDKIPDTANPDHEVVSHRSHVRVGAIGPDVQAVGAGFTQVIGDLVKEVAIQLLGDSLEA